MATVTKVADLNVAVSDTSAIYNPDDDLIYTFGGIDSTSDGSDAVQTFDPSDNSTAVPFRLPHHLNWTRAAYLNGKFYVAGNATDHTGNQRDGIYKVDPASQSATQIGELPWDDMFDFCVGQVDGAILLWGGEYNRSATSPNPNQKIYQIGTGGSVTEIGSMGVNQSDHGAGNLNGRLLSFGGNDTSGDTNEVRSDVYEVGSDGSFTHLGKITLNGNNFPIDRARGAVGQDALWFGGGREDNSGDSTATRDGIYNFNENLQLQKAGVLNERLEDGMAAYSPNQGSFYFLGGSAAGDAGELSAIYEVDAAVLSDFVYESGLAVQIGTGSQDYVREQGESLNDNGESQYVFINGTGIGRD